MSLTWESPPSQIWASEPLERSEIDRCLTGVQLEPIFQLSPIASETGPVTVKMDPPPKSVPLKLLLKQDCLLSHSTQESTHNCRHFLVFQRHMECDAWCCRNWTIIAISHFFWLNNSSKQNYAHRNSAARVA